MRSPSKFFRILPIPPGPGIPAIPLAIAVWAAWFVLLYGGLVLGCTLAPPAAQDGPWNWLNALLALVTGLTCAWSLRRALVQWQRRAQRTDGAGAARFLHALSASLHLAAAASMIVIAFPLLALPPCV